MKDAVRTWFLALGASAAAVCIPLALFFAKVRFDTRLVEFIDTRARLPFELFGLTSAMLVLGVAYSLRRFAQDERTRHVFFGLTLIALYGSIIVAECSVKSWDYVAYENAAKAIRGGGPIYGAGYLYPPLLALVLAGVSGCLEGLGRLLHVPLSSQENWACVFYLYQTSLFFLYVAAAALTIRLALRLHDRAAPALLVFITAIFIVNDAVLRTVQYNQANLLLLVLILSSLALMRRPLWAGLLLALAVHLKVYPLLLLLPLALGRRFKVCLSTLAFTVGIGLVQVLGPRHGDAWRQFFGYLPEWPRGVALRDNSIHSLLWNTAAIVWPGPTVASIALVGAAAAGLGAVAYLYRRQTRLIASLVTSDERAEGPPSELSYASSCRLVVDALPFLFLVSPMVWEHHWVVLLPFVATRGFDACFGRGKTDFVALGSVAAILMMPTADLYPLSYCRLAGLVVLVAKTHPARARGAVGFSPPPSRGAPRDPAPA